MNSKLYIKIDKYNNILLVSEYAIDELPDLIETKYNFSDFADIDITDGYHKYINDEIIKVDNLNVNEIPESMKESFRQKRSEECFSIINRGSLWYDSLTDSQKSELKEWYSAWLNVTETLIEPKKPSWLK